MDHERVDRFERNRDDNISRSQRIVPIHRANNNFEYEARVASSGIEACIEKICLRVRGRGTTAGVAETMRTAIEFAKTVLDAVRRAELEDATAGAWLYMHNLTFPLVAAALAGDWRLADRLAAATLSPVLREQPGSVHNHEAGLLGALFRDDRKGFVEQLLRFDKACKSSSFHRKCFAYRPLMQAILERDDDAFKNALILADKMFRERGQDRKLEGLSMLCAGPEYHDVVFDHYAVALCNLAKRRGLKVDFSSEAIPNDWLQW